MRKYVYLFELDSVRKSDAEIIAGQTALYHEIVTNGNIVVLTYNQLIDSRGFFSLLEHEDYYQSLIALFQQVAIKLSQYREKRTIAQYLMDSTGSETKFIYSSWPLKSTQRRLLALLKRSLMYSDLSELHGYLCGERSDAELADLFVEVDADTHTVQAYKQSIDQMREILSKLYWLIKTVLTLSPMHEIYIHPRDQKEYASLDFPGILHRVLRFQREEDAFWNEAAAILQELPCYIEKDSNRSAYHHALRAAAGSNRPGGPPSDRRPYQYAEAIVDLCYMYTCEISIRNISKHYNAEELISLSGPFPTFQADFFARLQQSWSLGNWNDRFLVPESAQFIPFTQTDQIPDLKKAVQVVEYLTAPDVAGEETGSHQGRDETREMESAGEPVGGVSRYEQGIRGQRKRQKRRLLRTIGGKLLSACFCILIVCLLGIGLQIVQSITDMVVPLDGAAWGVLETLIFLGLSEAVTVALSWLFRDRFPGMLSLSGALSGMRRFLKDFVFILLNRASTYLNPNLQDCDKLERFSPAVPICSISTAALKKYRAMRRDTRYEAYFEPSNLYPIADPDHPAVLSELLKLEELFDYQFGVVYQSQYNTLCVDPVQGPTGYFPYERIIPTGGNGVVIVPVYRGKFVLLQQFRHAPRKMQIAFPRGFAESGLLSAENAKKELGEELHAVIRGEPLFLGGISPDSGLTNTCASVYLVQLEHYQPSVGQEGILGTVEMSAQELGAWLRENRDSPSSRERMFDDGFTLGALLLYEMNMSPQGEHLDCLHQTP